MDDIEPLGPAVWFGAIDELARQPTITTDSEVGRLLRRAYHLLQLTPYPLKAAIRSDLSEDRLELLLECEAFDAAAIALVGQPMSFGVFHVAPGLFEAHVRLPDQIEPTAAQSPILAAALLTAWVQCLAALGERALTLRIENPHPVPRKARSGPHLKLIEH